MKFEVKRTSGWYNSQIPPCDNSKTEIVPSWDIRSLTEEEYNARLAKREGNWRSRGHSHTVIEGGIARVLGSQQVWTIEINDLGQLMEFSENYGTILISAGNELGELPEIEIYDDYRE